MKAKLVKILLDHDVTFRKVDETHVNNRGYCLEGFSVMSQHVLGNSKEEILEKMYDIHKKQQKNIKKWLEIPEKSKLMSKITDITSKEYDKDFVARYGNNTSIRATNIKTGIEWLKERWYDNYTVPDSLGQVKWGIFEIKVKRNDKPINWSLWENHRDLVNKWEAELKNEL